MRFESFKFDDRKINLSPHKTTIRPETVADYAAIARVHSRAFHDEPLVPLIVSYHRHRAAFDPELSLVAEVDGQVVGHVLFSPQTIRLLQQDVRAVNLAPIGIDPAYQKQGIGGELIRAGHEVVRNKGYALSFLLGHSAYYPRFGYKTRAYGASSLTVARDTLPDNEQTQLPLETRKPVEADVLALGELWQHEEGNVDFAIKPGEALLDWISPNPVIDASVYLWNGAVVGYTRIHRVELPRLRCLMAANHETARLMVSQLLQVADSIELPLHPYSASFAAFRGVVKCKVWDAGMVCSFLSNPFDEYYDRVQSGERQPGRPIWPVAFDLE
jgi:putative acetyltransferase